MGLQAYSQHSFYPLSRQLKPVGPLVRLDLQIRANRINEKINFFLENTQHKLKESNNVLSFEGLEQTFKVGVYGELGRGTNSDELAQDLICFLNEKRSFPNELQNYWAVFYDTSELTDSQFEEKVWQELSYLSAAIQNCKQREPDFNVDSSGKKISFRMSGQDFYVIGLHSKSGDISRRFHYATLIFSTDESLYPYQNH